MLKRILVAVVFIPLILVVMLAFPSVMTAVMVAVIASIACFELLRAVAKDLNPALSCLSMVTAVLIPLFIWLTGALGLDVSAPYLFGFAFMAVLFAGAIACHQTEREVSFDQIAVCLFGGVALPTLLGALVELRMMEHGKLWVLLPFVVAFTADAGGYFVGMFLGKHRDVIAVSPKKSLEGYAGALAAGVVSCLIFGGIIYLAQGIAVSFLALAVYGAIGAVLTALGDLSFSLIKRQHEIKDYGNLLPGHGGMMDRFDSMVFAAPAILLMAQIFPAF